MNEATALRRAIAQRIADAYITHPQARAAVLLGSTARQQCDPYSDIDMTIYYEKVPSREELDHAHTAIKDATERKPLFPNADPDAEEAVDGFQVDGIECQVGHVFTSSFEQVAGDVLERFDTDHDKHVIMGGLAECVPLHGAETVAGWKRKIAHYPDGLAESMVRAHLKFRPIWYLKKRIAGRDTLVVFNTVMGDYARRLLGVAMGLNRVYPEHDFKRFGGLTQRLETAPANFDSRLRTMLRSDYNGALAELDALVQDTFQLVEREMPGLDIAEERREFERPDPYARYEVC